MAVSRSCVSGNGSAMKLIAVKRISARLPKGAQFEASGMRARMLIAIKAAKEVEAPEPAPPAPEPVVDVPPPVTIGSITVTGTNADQFQVTTNRGGTSRRTRNEAPRA